MSELPLFLFRGKQRDRAKGRMELVRGVGSTREDLLLARDPSRAVLVLGKDRGWVAGMVERWEGTGATQKL